MVVPPDAGRSWWLREALALPEFAGRAAPALPGDTTADVVILGGGYTGPVDRLSPEAPRPGRRRRRARAGHLRRRPERAQRWVREQLLERPAPSGTHRSATTPRRACVEAGEASVAAIGAFCEEHEVDAWFAPTAT